MCESMVVLVVVKKKKKELVWCGVCGRYARHVGHVRFKKGAKKGVEGSGISVGWVEKRTLA